MDIFIQVMFYVLWRVKMKCTVTLQKGKNLTPQENPTKIIVTDDHSLFRTGVRNALAKKERIEIIGEAGNGLELLNLLEHLQPDIILLNMQMPVMHGIETLPVLKRKYPGIKVIIFSFLNDPSLICRMIEMGASSYFTKERGVEELYETILACHEKWFHINDIIETAIVQCIKEKPTEPLPPLSANQKNILQLLQQNKLSKEIADNVGLDYRTVDAIIDKLKKITGTKSVEELLNYSKEKKMIG